MRTASRMIAAVICGSAVSTGIIGGLLWWQTTTGGWAATSMLSLMIAIGILTMVIQVGALAMAEMMLRLGLSRLVGGTSCAAALMFGYISFIIISWNPTSRGYKDSLLYAGPDIAALVAACALGGLVCALIMLGLDRGRIRQL